MWLNENSFNVHHIGTHAVLVWFIMATRLGIYFYYNDYVPFRPQSDMRKKVPKLLLEYPHNFYLLCSSCFPLCLYYAPISTTLM